MEQGQWWWAHYSFGGSQLAWCNVCDREIAAWSQGWGTDGVPVAQRRKIAEHRASHPELVAAS